MSTATLQNPQVGARSPMHGGWDGLFLCARTKQKPGIYVAAPEFDAELHIETTTIMFADVVESVRLMEQDELGNVTRIRALLKHLVENIIPLHAGVVLERRGDGLLVRYPAARSAVACALDMHRACANRQGDGAVTEAISIRIGLHAANVFVGPDELYGRGVNLAARIAAVAGPAETTLSVAIRDQLTHDIDGTLEDLGDCDVKHFAEPVRIFKIWENALPTRPSGAEKLMESARPALAILPFVIDSNETKKSVVGELIADSLTTILSRARSIRVISRLSTIGLNSVDSGDDLRHLFGQKLRCDYLLSGRGIQIGSRLIVFVELSESHAGSIVWAERMEGETSELLATESSLIARICNETQLQIIECEIEHARVRPLPSLRSYSLYLAGLNLMHRQSQHDFAMAKRLFDHLSERHPSSAVPHAWLGKWHMLKVAQGWSNDSSADSKLAGRSASRALQREPENSLCLVIKGVIDAYLMKDFESAEKCYRDALQHNPSDALAHLQSAALFGWQGRAEEAVTAAREAMQLSPLDPHLYFSLCLAAAAHLGAGDYVGAETFARQSLRANRMHLATYKVLAMSQAMQGAMTDAAQNIALLKKLSPEFTLASFERDSPWRMHPRFPDLHRALLQAELAIH